LTAHAEPKNVARRIDIPVNYQTTTGTAMDPLRERLWNQRSAAGARLRTAARRNRDHLATSFLRFVFKQPQEFRPSLVVDVFCQKSTRQPSNLEILNRDQTEARDQPSAQLMSVIPPKVSDPLVQSSQ
jgi:hypothetical protein